jgi:Tartrate dehydratase alpha subunit/Fumarate hydratase class I, N-terminal domain
MREVHVNQITKVIRDLFIDANYNLGADVLAAFDRGIAHDESPVAKEVLKELKENARIAREEHSPICQDTGLLSYLSTSGRMSTSLAAISRRLSMREYGKATRKAI